MPDREMLAFVCVAAGHSRRFGSDKLAARLGKLTVLETSLAALRKAQPEALLVAVVDPAKVEAWSAVLVPGFRNTVVIGGGRWRQDSVRLGVERAAAAGAVVVAVHDGARPLVHPDDINRAIEALGEAAGVVLCAALSDTVKKVGDDGRVLETIDRRTLRLAQTPQVLRVSALQSAWQRPEASLEWSDEAALLEAAGFVVCTVIAEHPNPKLTTVADFALVQSVAGNGS